MAFPLIYSNSLQTLNCFDMGLSFSYQNHYGDMNLYGPLVYQNVNAYFHNRHISSFIWIHHWPPTPIFFCSIKSHILICFCDLLAAFINQSLQPAVTNLLMPGPALFSWSFANRSLMKMDAFEQVSTTYCNGHSLYLIFLYSMYLDY